jgi:hypothetical protein
MRCSADAESPRLRDPLGSTKMNNCDEFAGAFRVRPRPLEGRDALFCVY